MSSQDFPPRDVAESLTRVNLLTSLRGEVCPACGMPKIAGQSVCPQCWRQLPRRIGGELHLGIDQGYEGAMLRALRYLKVRRFVLPGEPLWEARCFPLKGITPALARQSLASDLCPHCRGRKTPGSVFCNVCLSSLRANMGGIAGKRGHTASLFYEELSSVESSIDPALLTTETQRYLDGFVVVIRWLKGRSFYVPK